MKVVLILFLLLMLQNYSINSSEIYDALLLQIFEAYENKKHNLDNLYETNLSNQTDNEI